MQQTGGYKALKILFAALLTGQLLFAVLSVYFATERKLELHRHDLDNVFLIVLAIIATICVLAGNKLFKQKTENLNNQQRPLAERFSEYRAASIIRWALLEGPCLFGIICLMLTANYYFLIAISILLLLFISTAPKKNKVANDLGINTNDLDAITIV
ncbi:MAG: hypothetical protein QM737_08745 [Ferruginibacter sp.]